jgi:DNA-binding MarR family transcriptional regulator
MVKKPFNDTEQLVHQINLFSKAVNCNWSTHNHLYIFAMICNLQPITLHDLQKKSGMKKATLNRIVHSLGDYPRSNFKGAGLISVKMMLNDRRQRNVLLTNKGKGLKSRMFREYIK